PLQDVVDLQVPRLVAFNLTGLEIEPVHVRNATRGVHDEIRLESSLAFLGTRMNAEARCHLLDSVDDMLGPNVDADALKALHEPSDEIRIETRKHAFAPLQYRTLRARMCRDV